MIQNIIENFCETLKTYIYINIDFQRQTKKKFITNLIINEKI